jgi:hypothetical protein
VAGGVELVNGQHPNRALLMMPPSPVRAWKGPVATSRRLAAYLEDERFEGGPGGPRRGQRTIEHWRGETLPMGVLYERAAVDFWTGVVTEAPDSRPDRPVGTPSLRSTT